MNPIHEALAQVHELRARILDRERFRGYSGQARAIGGCCALACAWIMSRPWYPASTRAHVVGWVTVCAVALAANYGALLYWFLFDPHAARNPQRLRPALEPLPALAVGAALSWALVKRVRAPGMLQGTWMCVYGLVNLAAAQSVPRTMRLVGFFYVACGCAVLLAGTRNLVNPWPMGCVFFAGELAGGLILYFDRTAEGGVHGRETPRS